jgi:putative inorganic carbon (hco3(-)) transporter
VPLSIGVAFSSRERKTRSWPWVLCAATIVAGTLVTLSRSAIVGMTVALLVMAWRWPLGRVIAAGGAAIVAVVSTALASPTVYDAFLRAFTGANDDPSLEHRAIGVQFVMNNFTKTLWFGWGTGAWNLWVLDNQYLGRLIEAGVIGLGGYIIVLAVPLALALRASRRAPREWSDVIRGIAAALSALMIINFILDTAGFAQIWTLTWILIAFAGVSWRLFPPKAVVSSREAVTASAP